VLDEHDTQQRQTGNLSCTSVQHPLLATGIAAGALDTSFSNEIQLEIWAPDFLDKDEYDLGGEGQHGAKGSINDGSSFPVKNVRDLSGHQRT
jgi:hypothetical protein